MPANKNAADVELTIFGGLCSELAATDLPQGVSPLTYDTDFDIGRVRSRDGLRSKFALVLPNQDALLLESSGSLLAFVLTEDSSGIVLLES